MIDVLLGFLTIWVVIGVGWVLAHTRVLDETAQQVLSKVTFFIGSPALLFAMMARADLKRVFAVNLLVSFLAAVASMLVFLGVSLVLRPRLDRPSRIIGTFASGYVNAANLGIPIAAYVLKDVTWVAPILLIQVAVLQPICLSLLDADAARESGRTPSLLRNLSLPLRNPMTIATVLGLVMNVLNWRIPSPIADPLELLGALAVPCMLIAYGLSLRLGPLPGRGGAGLETGLASGLKLLGQPLIAWLLARAFSLDPTQTMAVTVIAGLPTAQNVFVWAVRYSRGIVLARDTVFITTIASIPTITLIAALVHG
ncbi:AEC family transporter [Aestuariimicrobium soli]|uniref:AEC family transporter n=1 Tax=Aestuariimicrobium soli TaxID=2035834 RepID=UPI003EB97392